MRWRRALRARAAAGPPARPSASRPASGQAVRLERNAGRPGAARGLGGPVPTLGGRAAAAADDRCFRGGGRRVVVIIIITMSHIIAALAARRFGAGAAVGAAPSAR
eukprot:scaffold3887_cov269-Prasinococcus_capsulatus_cf.AAC.1